MVNYQEYIQSPEWRERRRERLISDGHCCAVCMSTLHLEVHHRTYERLGNEDIGDLLTLCRACHELFSKHGRLVRLTSETPFALLTFFESFEELQAAALSSEEAAASYCRMFIRSVFRRLQGRTGDHSRAMQLLEERLENWVPEKETAPPILAVDARRCGGLDP